MVMMIIIICIISVITVYNNYFTGLKDVEDMGVQLHQYYRNQEWVEPLAGAGARALLLLLRVPATTVVGFSPEPSCSFLFVIRSHLWRVWDSLLLRMRMMMMD